MSGPKILWVDDEIDLLRAHIIFLESKDYDVTTVNNGLDALELVKDNFFDIIFLDENMPGMSGLKTLTQIKSIVPNVPVVMITKSEEENIMDEAVGAKIADYLIKPVNPNQILLSLKKNIEQKQLVTKQTTSAYRLQFSEIGTKINEDLNFSEWLNIYKRLVFWEIELGDSDDEAMFQILTMQKEDANKAFFRYVKNNYLKWINNDIIEKPLLSHEIFKKKVFPVLDKGKKVFVIVIDNLRFDQWRVISQGFEEFFRIESDELYMSILPTATMYSRNAMFAGLLPAEIERMYPKFWEDDDNEGNKNIHEEDLLRYQLKRLQRKEKLFFNKVSGKKRDKQIADTINNILDNDLSVMVINFIDMISHARTEMEMIKELANNEKAYRSLTLSWFRHSSLRELIKSIAEYDITVVVTTDHGAIRVNNPVKVIGDRETNTNLRYKLGKNLNYREKHVFEVKKPIEAGLPNRNISTSYIFAHNTDFFAYPNNYNYYSNYYKGTFQHGGISMEEMIIPIVTLVPKK